MTRLADHGELAGLVRQRLAQAVSAAPGIDAELLATELWETVEQVCREAGPSGPTYLSAMLAMDRTMLRHVDACCGSAVDAQPV